jgi:putative flippase GtrA
MNAWVRWCKFNLVGALGMAVQLALLALFNRWWGGRYLASTAAAIELTLLHNFAWHAAWTWRDHHNPASLAARLLRFHLANGIVSFAGNLALTRLLVQQVHLPVLVANLIAILCCSVANFLLGDKWAFADCMVPTVRTPAQSLLSDAGGRAAEKLLHEEGAPATGSALLSLILLAILFWGAGAAAQTVESASGNASTESESDLPQVPQPQPPSPTAVRNLANVSYFYRIGAFCGAGASTSPAGTPPAFGCGAGATLVPLPIFVEFGVMGPQANRSYLSGYISLDGSIPFAPASSRYLPMAILGYSRFFETGHALDYGLALALPRASRDKYTGRSLRIELRDYLTFANPTQHNVMLRVGWMSGESD